MTPTVKEEDEDRIVLADSVAEKVLLGSALIISGLHCSRIFFSLIFDASVFGGLVGVLFGGLLLFSGLHILLDSEVISIDKSLQRAVIMKKSPITQFESIKKIPFSDIKIIEITYDTQCKNCDYDLPSMSLWSDNGSWDASIILIDGTSVQIYHGDHKSKAEKISGKICRITGKTVTHQTKYTPPIM